MKLLWSSALGYFDEEVLPHSVPHVQLYRLIKYIQETFGFECMQRGMHLHRQSDSLEKSEP